jgi:diguanylate cyclase (GGDEF)-like protein
VPEKTKPSSVDVAGEASSTAISLPSQKIGTPERAYLVILAGPQMGEMLKLEPGQEIVVGREQGVGLVLTDDGVSRQHARLSMTGSEVKVADLGSRNGTFVNGTRVSERVIADGDKIQIGVATTIRFTFTDNLEEAYQRRLLEAALRDPLTGIYNRRHFEERLQAEFSGARRHGTALALLVIDVDHFKKVNDTWGHLAGDAALKMVACTIQEALRKEDILARYGGEEFVVVARNTDLVGALQFGERIRRCVEGARCLWEKAEIAVTVSIGAAQLGVEATVAKLIEDADRAVYQAKRTGRNRVCATTDLTSNP